MTDAVVFNGLNALDFHDVRYNVIRIPEVSVRIREAQAIWDRSDATGFNLFNFFTAEDNVYLGNIKLKSLAAAVVQVGLYDRYLRLFRLPQFLVGNSNGDSPLLVAAGKITFNELVEESLALRALKPVAPLAMPGSPLLAGIALTEFSVYQLEGGGALEILPEFDSDKRDINKVVRRMIDEQEVRQFVNIGPGNLLLAELHHELALSDVQILESIDLDPMLSWFWPSMKRSSELTLVAQA